MTTPGRYQSLTKGRGASRRCFVRMLLMCAIPAATVAQDVESSAPAEGDWRVRLLAPISTKFNRKGDMVSARVLTPAKYQDRILEGDIREVRASGGNSGKLASVQFDFHTLHSSDGDLPVSAVLIEVFNSRQQSGVDDEGSALESGAHGLGGKLTGVFSRGATLHLASKAADLNFAPGSELVLQVRIRKAH